MSLYLLPRLFSALPVLGSRFYWAAHQFSAQRWARHHSSEKRKRPKRQEKLAYLGNLGMSRFNNSLQGKRRDSIAQQGGLQVRYKPKTKKRVILTIGNVLAVWACTVKEHSGNIKWYVISVHPPKKEQLNPRKLP